MITTTCHPSPNFNGSRATAAASPRDKLTHREPLSWYLLANTNKYLTQTGHTNIFEYNFGVGGGQLLAVITPGLLGIFSNLRQRWKAIDLFLTSIKVSFVAPLTARIAPKRCKKMKVGKISQGSG